jgi:succinate dehydrogenase / fumarate reductase cytochrome b subunit
MNDIRKAQMVGKATDASLVQRPLSPHLQVYRWPPTMLASILNRATGIAISVGSLLLVWWLAAAAMGPDAFNLVQNFVRSPLGLLLMLGWSAALFYHLFGGIRHLAWDMGYGFAKPSLNPVTYLVIGLTGIATAAVWLAAYLQIEA